MSSKTIEKQWKHRWIIMETWCKTMEKTVEKLRLRCGTIIDGKAMEKSRDYDEEVESNNEKTIEKLQLRWDQYRVEVQT